ncbi:MAG: DUF1015 domain-containing protein [Clostridia bacterium]|nr:DUF1015 domain-containing protein [Clostridia bacterium]
MSTVRPFCAVRPTPEFAAKIAALPYDVMNTEEARVRAEANPLTFLRVDRAEVDFEPGHDPYAPEVYAHAAELLAAYETRGEYRQDGTPRYYIYRQTMGPRSQTGIVGCASVDEYLSGDVRRHELTRADKEADRIRHVDACDANTGPIFLAYRHSDALAAIVAKYMEREPVYDFVSEGDVGNTVWVADEADNEKIAAAFAEINRLYIADGHHRCASAVKVALKRRGEHPDYDGSEEFNFFLAVLFDADELAIMDYNRVIADLNGMTEEEVLTAIGKNFEIEKQDAPVAPDRRHVFGMYLGKTWYRLTLKEGAADESDPVKSLDVSILQDLVNGPVFGIGDPRTDKRIDFVGGIRGLKELERRCETDMALAFSMHPTSMEELMRIADDERIMPPKSTWFEPKLLSGLFVHKLR